MKYDATVRRPKQLIDCRNVLLPSSLSTASATASGEAILTIIAFVEIEYGGILPKGSVVSGTEEGPGSATYSPIPTKKKIEDVSENYFTSVAHEKHNPVRDRRLKLQLIN